MRPLARCALPSAALLATAASLAAGPLPANPSFEQDGYRQTPGYARLNGGSIAGWRGQGGCGVNPVWRDPQAHTGPDAPFHDNGKVPEGRQLAFIQGPGSLKQTLVGLRQGHRYRVQFRENARVQRRGNEWPRLRVLLGGQVVVSPHEVTPVSGRDDFQIPFNRVESAWFVAPADGDFELAFETVQTSPTTTLLLDDVRIEVRGP
jgi:hypothetical protein